MNCRMKPPSIVHKATPFQLWVDLARWGERVSGVQSKRRPSPPRTSARTAAAYAGGGSHTPEEDRVRSSAVGPGARPPCPRVPYPAAAGDGTIETAEFLERMKLIGRQVSHFTHKTMQDAGGGLGIAQRAPWYAYPRS